jgi:hypothetical protein
MQMGYMQQQKGLGEYIPVNKEKYAGTRNPQYRSSWELKFMKYLDHTPSIVMWNSERIAIPYINPITKKKAKYYPDFFMKVLDKDKNIINYIIEIKPDKETRPPNQNIKNQKTLIYETKQWMVNVEKWKAAMKYCKLRDYQFKIITEKQLY